MNSTLLRAITVFAALAAPVAAMAQTPVGGTVVDGSLPAYPPYQLNGNAPVTIDKTTGGLRVLCVTGCSGSAVAGSMEQDVRATGTLAAATANAAIVYGINGQATVGFTFTGLGASGATITYEQSIDGGLTWTGINAVNRGTGVPEATRTTDGQIALSATGRTNIRVRVSTTGTGTITVASNISVREGIVSLGSPLPPGNNAIGSITNPFALEATQQGVAGSNAAINAATGTQSDTATASGANTTIIGALKAIRDRLLSTLTVSGTVALNQTTIGTTNGVSPAGFTFGNAFTWWHTGTLASPLAGGVSTFSRIPSSAATTNITVAKTSGGRIFKIVACNTTTTAVRIKFYDTASAPTPGTTPVRFTRPLPPAAAAGGLACSSYDAADLGWYFPTGIAYALTTGAADSDTTAVAAGAITDLSVEFQ